jgi:hypothetical protein
VIAGIEARRMPGFRSIDLVRRDRDHDVEFITLMWFDTIDSVKASMGADYETAHVPVRAQAVLAGFDRRSAHYQVLDRREQPYNCPWHRSTFPGQLTSSNAPGRSRPEGGSGRTLLIASGHGAWSITVGGPLACGDGRRRWPSGAGC